MTEWRTVERPSMLSVEPRAQVEGDIPDVHVITVRERRVTVDYPTIIQNNVNTDTIELDLDGEWDGMSVVLVLGPCGGATELAWHGEPLTLPSALAEDTGGIDVSVVGYSADGDTRLVTVAAPSLLNVIKSGCTVGEAPGDETPDLIGQLVAAGDAANKAAQAANAAATAANGAAGAANTAASAANTAAGKANTAATKATDAATKATDAAGDATRAAQSANAAAEAAGAAAEAARGNVLKGTLGPAPVLSADDAYATKPRRLTVFGETRQNLWVNPSGTNNGVTVTSNGDGSMTVSGTATSAASVSSADSYIIKPSTAYTLSMNAALTGASFVVTEYDAAGSQLAQHNVSSTSAASFTSSASVARCVMSLSVQSGQTVSGTYRVMLNEGSEAQPWCPPGLNSVEDVTVWQAGKNLLNTFYNASMSGLTATTNDDGSIDVSGTYTGSSVIALLYASGSLTWLYSLAGVKVTLSLAGAPDDKIYIQMNASVGGSVQFSVATTSGALGTMASTGTIPDGLTNLNVFIGVKPGFSGTYRLYPQLEFGEDMTDYEPPNVTSTPIDLDGHTLNSLPDGTRDELHIDADGEVTLTKRMGHVELDGSQSFSWQSDASSSYWESDDIARMNDYSQSMLCDRLPVKAHGYSEKDLPQSITGYKAPITTYPGQNWVYVRTPNATDATQVKTWLTSNPTLLLYQLAKPQTISLGKVDLPALPGPTANVWAVATDGHGNTFTLQPEIELEYARDVTLVIGSLEAKVAALELLHETE